MARYDYRLLLSEKNFLKVKQRARALPNGTNLVGIYYNDNELIFKTRSASRPNIVWTQRIQLTDASVENILNAKTYNNIRDLLLNSGMKIHCNCLAKGTIILTKEGYKNIEDVSESDFVLGGDGVWHKVAAVRVSEKKSNWFKINIRGRVDPLIVTDEHKILFSSYRDVCACGCGVKLRDCSDVTRKTEAHALFDRRRFIPKHANRPINDGFSRYQLHSLKEYKIGELLCTPIVNSTIRYDVNYARMLGYYLAEGHCQDLGNQVILTLNCDERDTIAADIKQYFNSIGVFVKIQDKGYKNQKWLVVTVNSKKYREDCIRYCGRGSLTKEINTEILEWSFEAKEAFVIGHLLGDGYIREDGLPEWLSTSKKLILGLQMVLSSMGIHSCMNFHNKYLNKLTKYGDKCNENYKLSCTANSFYKSFEKYQHLFIGNKVEKNNSRGQNDVDKYVLNTITSIEKLDVEMEGYDICLFEEPHTFVANNVIVSNCEAFLYWGYQYIATKHGYSIIPEKRRPVVRNPYEQGHLCKHLFLALSTFPFWVSELASKYLNHYKSSIEQESEQLMDSRKKRLLRNPYGVRPKPLKW